jgi:hypothetical protein
MSMKVEHSIGLDRSAAQAPIPAAVKRRILKVFGPF